MNVEDEEAYFDVEDFEVEDFEDQTGEVEADEVSDELDEDEFEVEEEEYEEDLAKVKPDAEKCSVCKSAATAFVNSPAMKV